MNFFLYPATVCGDLYVIITCSRAPNRSKTHNKTEIFSYGRYNVKDSCICSIFSPKLQWISNIVSNAKQLNELEVTFLGTLKYVFGRFYWFIAFGEKGRNKNLCCFEQQCWWRNTKKYDILILILIKCTFLFENKKCINLTLA